MSVALRELVVCVCERERERERGERETSAALGDDGPVRCLSLLVESHVAHTLFGSLVSQGYSHEHNHAHKVKVALISVKKEPYSVSKSTNQCQKSATQHS